MRLQVNEASRYAKMRAHTATHLLHAELGNIFPQTKQAGSLVDEDYVRFDFHADRLLSDKEIHTIEHNINSAIAGAFPVSVAQTSFQEATQMGAKAFFEDKYGDVVRVVSVDWIDIDGNVVKKYHSLELCGGTHVGNTKDIGSFVIIGQQAVASGVKRITAYTGPKVIEHIQEKNVLLADLAEKLNCSVGQMKEKLDKVLSESCDLKERLESSNWLILTDITHNRMDHSKSSSYSYFNLNQGITEHRSVKEVVPFLKSKNLEGNFIFEDRDGGFLIWSSQLNAKKLMAELGRKGGGNEQLCQGKIS